MSSGRTLFAIVFAIGFPLALARDTTEPPVGPEAAEPTPLFPPYVIPPLSLRPEAYMAAPSPGRTCGE